MRSHDPEFPPVKKTSTNRRTPPAERAWRLMFDFLMRSAPQRITSLRKRGLTPNDSRALFTLNVSAGRPMGALAREWECDASTATWLVDRLEKAGLVVRQPSAEDRRVKLIRLSAKGAKIGKQLLAEYYRPQPEIVALSGKDLTALIRVLEKLNSR